jgi:uncharacterized protein (TIGR02145 family)
MKQLSTLLFCLFLFSGLAAQNLPTYLPSNGLVGWWPFNGNANDESGNGNHLTNINSVSYTVDRFGNTNSSSKFTESSQEFIISNPNLPEGNSNRSFSVWYQTSDLQISMYTIFEQVSNVSTCNTSFSLYANTNGCYFASTCDDRSWGTPGIETWGNYWINLILVYENNRIKCYKNGILLNDSNDPNYYNFSNSLNTSTNTFHIGRPVTIIPNWVSAFKGQIDDIAIYNRALTQQEITALYQAGNPTSLQYQLQQQKEGNCPTSPVRLSVKTQPRVFTDSVGSINASSATVYGSITNDGGQDITSRGICWSTSPNPMTDLPTKTQNGSGMGSFSGNLSGLSPSTTYYARAYAISAAGTWYGNELAFTTSGSVSSATCGTPNIHNPNLSYGSMSDQDGNVYKTIVIGTQEWMAENLKTGHYRNGEEIPVVNDTIAWEGLNSGACCWYSNDSSSFDCPYGRLYNWYTVADSRGLCPAGWHVPSDEDWKTMEFFLGMPIGELDLTSGRGFEQNVGGKLKSVSTLWTSSNAGATNETGFSGLPGGYWPFHGLGPYGYVENNSYWWSSTEHSNSNAYNRSLDYSFGYSARWYSNKQVGFSVRCLKDAPETGSINSLDCGGAVNAGTIYSGQAVSSVTVAISYTGGNGGNYNSRLITSIGVTGLTATLEAGSFVNGDSSINFRISGTPVSSGNASFALNIGGQSCSFTCLVVAIGGGLTDIDGNTYGSVIIGNQEWMSENLKVSKYKDGDTITNNLNESGWENTVSGAYGIYNNNGAYGIYNDEAVNDSIFGKLYNWYAVADPRGLCPVGWHIPGDEEWSILENFLGGSSVAGGKMKSTGTGNFSAGTGLWEFPNTDATNSSGFSGLPGSLRQQGGIYSCAVCPNGAGIWWSSTEMEIPPTYAWDRTLYYSAGSSYRNGGSKNTGCSVRCLKD